ncbi:hypothetical protein JCM13580A_46800 [Streptomyces drozdowiczii]
MTTVLPDSGPSGAGGVFEGALDAGFDGDFDGDGAAFVGAGDDVAGGVAAARPLGPAWAAAVPPPPPPQPARPRHSRAAAVATCRSGRRRGVGGGLSS